MCLTYQMKQAHFTSGSWDVLEEKVRRGGSGSVLLGNADFVFFLSRGCSGICCCVLTSAPSLDLEPAVNFYGPAFTLQICCWGILCVHGCTKLSAAHVAWS